MQPPTRKNVRTDQFHERLAALPQAIRDLAEQVFQVFLQDPNHRSLRRHALKDHGRGHHRANSISVSINMQYRAIYVEDGDTNVWYWIGSHADYNRFIGMGG